MSQIDAETFAQQATLLGLVSREEAALAKSDAEDGSLETLIKSFQRKELLTRWQVDKLIKNDPSGFFFGGCKVLFHIAEGTFARVYRGVRVMGGGDPVAIKVLRNRFVSDSTSIAQFREEAEAGLRLVHPNIVRMFEFGEEDKKQFMIMEYVEGSNLREFLKYRGKLSETESLPLMLGLVAALQFSHGKGIAHRDIKGTNILIASNGTAKLVDFGLATIEGDDRKNAAAHGQRTVDYSALERSCGSQKGDPRSDIFFLGCVFYQMLTGQLPLPEVETSDPLAKMLKRGINSIKPLRDHPYAPSEELTRIVETMMKVDLKLRYKSFEEVHRDLDTYLSKIAAATSRTRKARPVLADGEVAEVRGATPRVEEDGTGSKTLLCVEYQDEIRDAFRKTFTKMGYRVLLVAAGDSAAERYREEQADAIVFDLDGLGADGLGAFLEMYELAQEEGHDFAALVLLGPRQHYLSKNLPTDDRVVILSKPIKMKEVQDAILGLVPVKA